MIPGFKLFQSSHEDADLQDGDAKWDGDPNGAIPESFRDIC